MMLITAEIQKKLEKNFADENDKDVVLKLFGGGACTWLITQIEPDNDTMWGLCDLGMGCAEYGTVSLSELKSARFRFGLGVERDTSFRGGTVEHFTDLYDERGTLAGC